MKHNIQYQTHYTFLFQSINTDLHFKWFLFKKKTEAKSVKELFSFCVCVCSVSLSSIEKMHWDIMNIIGILLCSNIYSLGFFTQFSSTKRLTSESKLVANLNE